MPDLFEPSAHRALIDLGSQLRELAGDSAYQAGRDYLRKGLVKQGAVAGTTAFATVSGSTDYRVSVGFADPVKVTCTCPAHRRNKFCKHVVAVGVALLERPADFAVSEAPPEVHQPPVERRSKARVRAAKQDPASSRVTGLETIDRLLLELAGGGVASLGPDQAALLANAGELVRALKLRRLGNLVLALQRAAIDGKGRALEGDEFASLLVDLYLTRRAAGAHLEEKLSLDPRLAEDLLGRTWREEELEPVRDLELFELAGTRVDDGEFRVETSYLADLATGSIYAEKQITPVPLFSAPKSRHRHRLLVDEAGLYPGVAPRRIRLRRVHRAPLTTTDVDRLVAQALDSVPELRRRLVERLRVPFGPADVAVIFRPTEILVQEGLAGSVDGAGSFLALDWPANWADDLVSLLPKPGRYALFGLLTLGDRGMRLRCLAAISGELHWGRGPVYPDREKL